jgi:hypothetical protein
LTIVDCRIAGLAIAGLAIAGLSIEGLSIEGLSIEGLIAAPQDHQNARPFSDDEAATKLIWLALRTITAGCRRAAPPCRAAMNQFATYTVTALFPPQRRMHGAWTPTRNIVKS